MKGDSGLLLLLLAGGAVAFYFYYQSTQVQSTPTGSVQAAANLVAGAASSGIIPSTLPPVSAPVVPPDPSLSGVGFYSDRRMFGL